MPKEVIGLYDPRIPPERELHREFMAAVDEQRGKYATIRKGEQYICTCICDALMVTSFVGKAYDFTDLHQVCNP